MLLLFAKKESGLEAYLLSSLRIRLKKLVLSFTPGRHDLHHQILTKRKGFNGFCRHNYIISSFLVHVSDSNADQFGNRDEDLICFCSFFVRVYWFYFAAGLAWSPINFRPEFMIFPWMFDEIHGLKLKPFKVAAKKEYWPPLYDVATLKNNKRYTMK
ncbi:hypothetical protein CARUB_v10018891mg [Capsella rubella]|uniref:Uncharacterized protein n=1 Tax=Capsella rubella TaxID=81985 RepID=R0FSZ4_9BRAS|nr:hypothetical protein CARUB_v10018891mg [Capsella rubella]